MHSRSVQGAWYSSFGGRKRLEAQALKLENGPSLLKLRVPNVWLDRYPNQEDAGYLRLDFRDGFRILAMGVRQGYMPGDLKSV